MENDRFKRFNPTTDNHREYIQQGLPEQVHARAVSVLTGIFNPLVDEFTQRITGIDPQNVAHAGEEPVLWNYQYDYERERFFDIHPLRILNKTCVSRQHSLPLNAPVGDYGPELSFALVQSGRSLYTLLDKHMKNLCRRTNRQYKQFLVEETFRKNSLQVLKEAVQSTVGGLAILTAEKVSGYEEDPLGLCKKVVDEELLERVAALIPLGNIFPMAQDGIVFYTPLVHEEGNIQLSPSLQTSLRDARAFVRANKPTGPQVRRRGCPAAVKTINYDGDHYSGVTLLSQVMYPFIAHEYQKITTKNSLSNR